MERVQVGASKKYEVLIGRNILKQSGELIAAVKKPCRAVLVTDDIVEGLYAGKVEESLRDAGFSVVRFVFKNGERQKSMETFSALLDYMAENSITRTDLAIALGGGVCGDLCGFAAACYLRGIDYVQIPTTLLAAVDSSVGGKTAIDIAAGKNLVGAFHQPILVICDADTLSTLRPETFADGAAESIKYGVLTDAGMFEAFSSGRAKAEIEHIIKRAVEIKSSYVEQDEFDTGLRMFLNLGHTAAHSIEKLSDFSVSHGHAVAVGMVIVSDISVSMGIMSAEDAKWLRDTLVMNGLPISTEFDGRALGEAALSDKKRSGDMLSLILPEGIGRCRIEKVRAGELSELFSRSKAVGIRAETD